MKKILFLALIAVISLQGCSRDNIDSAHSIFDSTLQTPKNEFDYWLLSNYVQPYNVDFKYRLDDTEVSVNYQLVPATYEKAVAVAKIVKHVWLEAYDECWGQATTSEYVPKVLQLVGNVAYTSSGNILGQAEGGMKVTLFNINTLNIEKLDMALLNEYYFKTMHHEFAHILNQKKPYNPDFDRITEADYIGSDWYSKKDEEALKAGFISPYSMDRASEDFVELIAIYVVSTEEEWNKMLETAGTKGKNIILQKFAIVRDYMEKSWNLDLDKLRKTVLRRQSEIQALDLKQI